jgi:hypothetical protein
MEIVRIIYPPEDAAGGLSRRTWTAGMRRATPTPAAVKLPRKESPFALGHNVTLEHYVPVG